MKWKRKGGRSVAEEAGVIFRVEDDGTYSYRTPQGEWLHEHVSDAAMAKTECEEIAGAYADLGALEGRMLAIRRKQAAELAALDPAERSWAEGLAGLLVGVAHAEVTVEYVAEKLQGGSRALFERLAGQADIMAVLADLPKEQARDRVMRSVLKSLQRQREEGEE